MLSYRILTALILIPLVLWGIFVLPQLPFTLVTGAILLLGAWEWAGFMNWTKIWQRLLYVSIILLFLLASLLIPPWISFVVGAFWWMIALFQIASAEILKKIPILPKLLIGLIGVFVLIPCWQAVIVLHLRPRWLLLLFLMVWFADTIAYFGGKLWGKHPLAPTISPKKTTEGVYSIFLVGLIFIIGWQMWLYGSLQLDKITTWATLMTVTIIAAIVGDLYESLLKRGQGLKDSGNLLPGHGGLLDRIDSLTAAAPVFICIALSLKLI